MHLVSLKVLAKQMGLQEADNWLRIFIRPVVEFLCSQMDSIEARTSASQGDCGAITNLGDVDGVCDNSIATTASHGLIFAVLQAN